MYTHRDIGREIFRLGFQELGSSLLCLFICYAAVQTFSYYVQYYAIKICAKNLIVLLEYIKLFSMVSSITSINYSVQIPVMMSVLLDYIDL